MSNAIEKKPLLEVMDLKQHFPIESGFIFKRQIGAVRAVDGISFNVNEGETLGIVGESGCGKSTTVRSIAQLYRPTSGSVIFDGVDLVHAPTQQMLDARKKHADDFPGPLCVARSTDDSPYHHRRTLEHLPEAGNVG